MTSFNNPQPQSAPLGALNPPFALYRLCAGSSLAASACSSRGSLSLPLLGALEQRWTSKVKSVLVCLRLILIPDLVHSWFWYYPEAPMWGHSGAVITPNANISSPATFKRIYRPFELLFFLLPVSLNRRIILVVNPGRARPRCRRPQPTTVIASMLRLWWQSLDAAAPPRVTRPLLGCSFIIPFAKSAIINP